MMSEEKIREPLFSVTSKDCRWDYYRGSGKGGQKRNKTSSAVRCTHIDSNAVGQSEDGRSQFQNKKEAFKRMTETEKFKKWLWIESCRIKGALSEAEKKAERDMNPKNLKIEVKENGKWKTVNSEDIKEED